MPMILSLSQCPWKINTLLSQILRLGNFINLFPSIYESIQFDFDDDDIKTSTDVINIMLMHCPESWERMDISSLSNYIKEGTSLKPDEFSVISSLYTMLINLMKASYLKHDNLPEGAPFQLRRILLDSVTPSIIVPLFTSPNENYNVLACKVLKLFCPEYIPELFSRFGRSSILNWINMILYRSSCRGKIASMKLLERVISSASNLQFLRQFFSACQTHEGEPSFFEQLNDMLDIEVPELTKTVIKLLLTVIHYGKKCTMINPFIEEFEGSELSQHIDEIEQSENTEQEIITLIQLLKQNIIDNSSMM